MRDGAGGLLEFLDIKDVKVAHRELVGRGHGVMQGAPGLCNGLSLQKQQSAQPSYSMLILTTEEGKASAFLSVIQGGFAT